jgi:hypothetical protein
MHARDGNDILVVLAHFAFEISFFLVLFLLFRRVQRRENLVLGLEVGLIVCSLRGGCTVLGQKFLPD